MTNKERLEQYWVIKRQHYAISREIEDVLRRAEYGGGMSDTVSKPTGESRVENAVCHMDELLHELRDKLEELSDMEQKILRAINGVADNGKKPNDFQNVLISRYIQRKSWQKIAFEMQKSVRSVQRLNGRALQRLSFEERAN